MLKTGKIVFNDEKVTVDFYNGDTLVHRFSPEPIIRLTGEEEFLSSVYVSRIEKNDKAVLLTYIDGDIIKIASISIKNDVMHYRAAFFGNGETIETLKYGNDEIIYDNADKVVRESIFTWAPDLYESLIPYTGKLSVELSTLELKDHDSMMRAESGRFIMPPYVAAISLNGVCLGCGTPEVPRSIQGLKPCFINRALSFEYEYQGHLACLPGGGQGAELMLYLEPDRDSVINTYCDYIFEIGAAKTPVQWEDWWGGPLYCSIGDQVYENMLQTSFPKEPGVENTCNESFMNEIFGIMDEKEIEHTMVVLDAGWMKNMAMFDVNEKRFPDMRRFSREQHEKGRRVILWIAPFHTTYHMTGDCEYIFKNHPDWMVKTRSGETRPYLDYTHPEVREFMRQRMHYMLSNAEGCLDCDGLKVDFYYQMFDPGGFNFHDPSYGTGELLQYKAFKHLYDCAKEAKPDCFVECSSANPLFNDIQDACRLNDDLSNSKAVYEKRCWTTIQSRCNVPDTDDWWSYMDYFVNLTIEKCVFGIPALYAVKYRGVQGQLISGWESAALGGNPVNIPEEDYRRVSAISKVYSNCPVNLNQRREIDLKKRKFARYHTTGPIAGFPAAATLCDDKVLFTCNAEKTMMACAIEPVTARLPIPQGLRIDSIVKTCGGKSSENAEFELYGDEILIDMNDAGDSRCVYTIRFM